MMVLQHILCLGILTTIVTGSFGRNDDGSRSNGYDLERGPVFYEAYPEDHVDESAGGYREKRFFDRGVVRERSFQVPAEYPYDGHPVDVSRSVADNVPYLNERMSELNFPSGDNYFSHPINEMSFAHGQDRRRLPFDENDRRLSRSRRAEGQSTFEAVGRISQDEHPEIEPMIWSTFYWQGIPEEQHGSVEKIRNLREELPRTDSRISSRKFGRSDLIRRAPPLLPRYLQSRQLIPESRPNDPKAYWSTHSRPPTMLENYPRRIDDSELWGANEKRSAIVSNGELTENIFEPRPQVINYVFSRKPTKSASQQSTKPESIKTKNTGLANQSSDRSKNEPEVASIQVSEIPRHKTRHHHGEWLMRDNSRRSHS